MNTVDKYVIPTFNIFVGRQSFNGSYLVRYLVKIIFVNALKLKG